MSILKFALILMLNIVNSSVNSSSYEKPKLVILIGETGAGKSSFVNYFAGINDPLVTLSKVCHGIDSCTEEPQFHTIERTDFGTLMLMDTKGFNDAGGEANAKVILRIFRQLFRNNFDYIVDAIIYLEDAATPKSQFNKYYEEFTKIFGLDANMAKDSFVYMHTKLNRLVEDAKKDHEQKVAHIDKKFAVAQIDFDTKIPIDNQLEQLRLLINKTRKIKLSLGAFEEQIVEIAKGLRENDRIIKYNKTTRTVDMKSEKEGEMFIQEDVSDFGLKFWGHFQDYKKYTTRKMLDLKIASPRSLNAINVDIKVKNFKYYHLYPQNIIADDNKYPISISLSNESKSIICSFFVRQAMFGKGTLKFDYSYDIEYQVQYTDDISYIEYREDLDYYMKQATDIFISNKVNERPKEEKVEL